MSDKNQESQGFVQLCDTALLKELQGETVVLDLRTEAYFALDAIGSDILHTATQQPDLKHAVRVLVERYEVEEAILEEDIRALLTTMRNEGLITGTW